MSLRSGKQLSSVGVTLSTTALASDDDFVRFDVQHRNYFPYPKGWPLFENWVAVVALAFTDVELYGDTDVVPPAELLKVFADER